MRPPVDMMRGGPAEMLRGEAPYMSREPPQNMMSRESGMMGRESNMGNRKQGPNDEVDVCVQRSRQQQFLWHEWCWRTRRNGSWRRRQWFQSVNVLSWQLCLPSPGWRC